MRHRYSKEERQYLIDNVKGITLKELTQRFNEKFATNLSESVIQNQKSRLGLYSGITGGQFKKGHIAVNYRPIGSERFAKDGYIEIKVKEPNKWEAKHRVIYKSMYGNIPTRIQGDICRWRYL